MADTFNGDFARLVPRNQIAQYLFSATRIYVDDNKTFHLRFLQSSDAGSEMPTVSDEPVESSTDYDSQIEGGTEDFQTENLGYFVLSFNEKREPEFPHLGWRVGRGAGKASANRGVDLLLSKPGHSLSRSLASVHMIFHFNRRSGLLMLKGGSPRVPVEYKIGHKWVKLSHEEEFLIYETSIRIRAGVCEYDLEHMVDDEHKETYFAQRDRFLVGGNPELPEKPLQRMPGDRYISRGQYLELETRGSGSFGWITQGLDTKTGDPVAIKELRIDKRTKSEVMAEVKMGTRFTNEPGLLPTLNTVCEHGHSEICCDLERFFLFMPIAISDFTGNFWRNNDVSSLAKLHLLKEPLEGLKTLHAMGIMHRDIRPRNMLILRYDPPRASLCDYGKAVEGKTATVTTIGPIHTLAPEVWTIAKDGPYTARIDTWAYGYAIAEILGYKSPDNSKITQQRLTSIYEFLQTFHGKGTEGESLVDLVSKLLVWRPQDRWSADQALKHECWLPIARKQDQRSYDDLAEAARGKRALLDDPRPDPPEKAISDTDAQKTQEFSQETKAFMVRELARQRQLM